MSHPSRARGTRLFGYHRTLTVAVIWTVNMGNYEAVGVWRRQRADGYGVSWVFDHGVCCLCSMLLVYHA